MLNVADLLNVESLLDVKSTVAVVEPTVTFTVLAPYERVTFKTTVTDECPPTKFEPKGETAVIELKATDGFIADLSTVIVVLAVTLEPTCDVIALFEYVVKVNVTVFVKPVCIAFKIVVPASDTL